MVWWLSYTTDMGELLERKVCLLFLFLSFALLVSVLSLGCTPWSKQTKWCLIVGVFTYTDTHTRICVCVCVCACCHINNHVPWACIPRQQGLHIQQKKTNETHSLFKSSTNTHTHTHSHRTQIKPFTLYSKTLHINTKQRLFCSPSQAIILFPQWTPHSALVFLQWIIIAL